LGLGRAPARGERFDLECRSFFTEQALREALMVRVQQR